MIVGGQTSSSSVSTAEIIDMSSSKPCRKIKDFPVEEYGLVGAYIGGKPMFCGGQSSKKCYTYDFASDDWSEVAPVFKNNRRSSESVVFPNGTWWVIGTSRGSLSDMQTTEVLQPVQRATFFNSLPRTITT